MSTDFANLLIWPLDYPGKPQCPDSSSIHLEKMGTPCLKQWFRSSECRIKSKPLSTGTCTLQNLSRCWLPPLHCVSCLPGAHRPSSTMNFYWFLSPPPQGLCICSSFTQNGVQGLVLSRPENFISGVAFSERSYSVVGNSHLPTTLCPVRLIFCDSLFEPRLTVTGTCSLPVYCESLS